VPAPPLKIQHLHSSMLEAPLSGKDHGHGRIGFVAGFDDFVVPDRAACVGHCGDTLADAHVHPIPEGEERV
jgi:hypothetical protein